jgi:hypothetical protein
MMMDRLKTIHTEISATPSAFFFAAFVFVLLLVLIKVFKR